MSPNELVGMVGMVGEGDLPDDAKQLMLRADAPRVLCLVRRRGCARGRAVVGGRAWVAVACYVADFFFFGGKLYYSAFLFPRHKLSSSVLTDFKKLADCQ